MNRRLLCTLALASLPFSLSACTVDSTESETEQDHRVLADFGSCEDLLTFVRGHAREALEASYADVLAQQQQGACIGGCGIATGDDVEFPTDGIPDQDIPGEESDQSDGDDGSVDPTSGQDKGDTNSDGVPDHSQTNNQETNVDEPDLVKTDGLRILALARGMLHHVDLRGMEPVLTDSIAIDGRGWGNGEMFLLGNRAYILTQTYVGEVAAALRPTQWQDPAREYDAATRIVEVDISNPFELREVRRMHVFGSYASARLTGDSMRLVLQSSPVGLPLRDVWSEIWEQGVGTGEGTDGGQSIPGSTGSSTPGTGVSTPGSDPSGGAKAPAQCECMTPEQLQATIGKVRAYNESILAASTVDNWLPSYVLEDFSGAQVATSSGLLYNCESAMRPGQGSGLDLLSVITFDLKGGLSAGAGTGVYASTGTVYASSQSLYVATSPWQWGMPVMGGISIGRPEVLNEGIDIGVAESDPGTIEPSGGASDAPDAVELRAEEIGPKTYIHRFDTPLGQAPIYKASGSIDGYLLSQYSMSEHNGDLRVAATTFANWWWGGAQQQEQTQVSNFVSVLREQEGELKQIGQVSGLGKGETIHAVRFVGDVGYVVTFRQTDPLYTLDLSRPEAPVAAGELKILGYSAYLHPLAGGQLLGVGRSATPDGQVTGLQVSLFDVSNLAQPNVLAQYELNNAGTDVEWDAHAFLYWPATQTAVIPMSYWDQEILTDEKGETTSGGYFQGALVLNVGGTTGISEAGRISHPEVAYPDGSIGIPDETIPVDPGEEVDPNQDDGDIDPGDETTIPGDDIPTDPGDQIAKYVPALVRSVVVGDTLYTLSEGGLKGSALAGLADLSWIEFPSQE